MIYQLFISFVFKRPTTSSQEEKELEITDLPKVAICLEHGFNNVTLKKHGYHVSIYFRGALKPLSRYFVGWNGEKDDNMSSTEILEETLVVPKSEDLIIFANYTEDDVNFEKADVTFSIFGYDIGHCMLISPPLNANNLFVRHCPSKIQPFLFENEDISYGQSKLSPFIP